MTDLRFDASTVVREKGTVRHRLDAFPELERVSRGEETVRAYRDRPESIDELFRRAVERSPDRDALVFPESDTRVTYAELDDRVTAVAGTLQAVGVTPSDHVMIHLTNRLEFVEAYFACARLNAVSMPTNTRLQATELAYLLSDAEPATVVTESELVDELVEADYDLPTDRTFIADGDDRFRPFSSLYDGDDPNVSPPAEDDLATLLYTSGTTGRPKGCLAEHFHLVNSALNCKTSFGSEDGVRSLVTVPLFHGTGLTTITLHTVACAGTTVILDGYSPTSFLETIADENIEFVIGVPTNYILAIEKTDPTAYDLDEWRVGAYGGAPMPAPVVSRLRDAFPDLLLVNAYGTTETMAGLATMCPDRYTDEYAQTIGIPTGPVELKIVDDNDRPLGTGEVGELAIKGPIVVDRYLNRPDATDTAFENGWHYTGDLATIDEDGFVELKGRNTDLIVRGGENVYALDVEEALMTSDLVLDAAVTGFPDDVLGERVLAAVVPKEDARLTEEHLRAICEDLLAEYKRPEIYRIVDALPRNPNGKVVKEELLLEPLAHGIRAG